MFLHYGELEPAQMEWTATCTDRGYPLPPEKQSDDWDTIPFQVFVGDSSVVTAKCVPPKKLTPKIKRQPWLKVTLVRIGNPTAAFNKANCPRTRR
jgi:hypothetical protein